MQSALEGVLFRRDPHLPSTLLRVLSNCIRTLFIQNAKKMQPWELLSLRTHFQHLKQMGLNLFGEVFRILNSNS